jgi:hypothetical protein
MAEDLLLCLRGLTTWRLSGRRAGTWRGRSRSRKRHRQPQAAAAASQAAPLTRTTFPEAQRTDNEGRLLRISGSKPAVRL